MFDPPSLIALGMFMLLNFAAASSGAVFRPGEWYETLNKPSWVPPNWAFPVVWTVLFILNAVAGWLVWEAAGFGAGLALGVYVASLAINAFWSALFFGARRMDYAMGDVIVLWLSLIVQIALFAQYSRLAALLGLPYLVWVTTAALLNLRMIQLNPRELPQAG